MDVELINPFLSATLNVLSTMAQTKVTPGKPELKKDNHTFGAVTGIIGMAGDHIGGNLIISFEEAAILAIVNRMLGEDNKIITEGVVDAVGEITNIICGGAKSIFSEQGLSIGMATPMMLLGKGVELNQLSKKQLITIPLSTPEGKFVIETNLTRLK